jgi:hypothetical protein
MPAAVEILQKLFYSAVSKNDSGLRHCSGCATRQSMRPHGLLRFARNDDDSIYVFPKLLTAE